MNLTLNQYINYRLDGVKGEIPRLIHMFKKSFTASSFRRFWNIWNPIFTYVLSYYVYKPLRKIVHRNTAVVLTFVINGLFHDLIVWIVLRRIDFLMTSIFLVYGVAVISETYLLSQLPKNKIMRVAYNMSMLFGPVLLMLWVKKL